MLGIGILYRRSQHALSSLLPSLLLFANSIGLPRQCSAILRKLDDQQVRVRELSRSVRIATESLERERQLAAVSHDVRELMGARNLHIIDVQDMAESGNDKKPFGRVFYAEGQTLIFYAFDLPLQGLSPAKYTFQAWGQREAGPGSLRSLGTFEVDSHEQHSWVLKVTNHALLAGIDSVFVTAEPLIDAQKPAGKKLLYAYIMGPP